MKHRPIATTETRRNLYLTLAKHYREQAEKASDPAAKQVWLNKEVEAEITANSLTQQSH